MLYGGIDWPEGWQPGDRHVTSVLGLHVFRPMGSERVFRVRRPFVREINEGNASKDDWIAEYLTRSATHHIGKSADPHVACGLCLLYDTTEADAEAFW